jgi:hypothetical protein
VLFVSGTKDALSTIEELETAVMLIPAETRLVAADHSLLTKVNRQELPKRIAQGDVSA